MSDWTSAEQHADGPQWRLTVHTHARTRYQVYGYNWLWAVSLEGLQLFFAFHCIHYNPETQTHLGRLGCGEVKPGRDKVMLRHLGPVFPVSGLRHQTSWPGSDKRKIWICFKKNRKKTKTKSDTQMMTYHFFQGSLSTISYLEFYRIKFSFKTSSKSCIFSRQQQSFAGWCCACEVDNCLTAWIKKISCAAWCRFTLHNMCVCVTYI